MNAETLRIIADALEGKVKLEILDQGKWQGIHPSKSDGEFNLDSDPFIGGTYVQLIKGTTQFREAVVIPMLTTADAYFAEWYIPKDYYLARDNDRLLHAFSAKPVKMISMWCVKDPDAKEIPLSVLNFPVFGKISWKDPECYTVLELLQNYHEYSNEKGINR